MTFNKPKRASPALRRMLRQASGRYASKFTLGGREKRLTRGMPSLARLKCLAESETRLVDKNDAEPRPS
jgi:hypothetical protein